MGYAFTVTTSGNSITVNPRTGGNITIAQTGTQVSINTNATLIRTATLADTYKGAWTSGTSYTKGDTVKYLGEVYLATNSITSSTTAPDTDTANWTLFSSSTAPTTYSTLTVTQVFTAAANSAIVLEHPTIQSAHSSITVDPVVGLSNINFSSTQVSFTGSVAINGPYGLDVDIINIGGANVNNNNGAAIYVNQGDIYNQIGNVVLGQGHVNVGNEIFFSSTSSPPIGYITGTNIIIAPSGETIIGQGVGDQTQIYGVLRINNNVAVSDSGEVTVQSIHFPDGSIQSTAAGDTTLNYTSIAGTDQVQLDSIAYATYDAVKYFIRVRDGSNYHVEEIVMFYDGTNIDFSEYGIITNNGLLGTFTADVSGSNIRLLFTPNGATSMSIRIARTLMAV